MGLDRGRDKGRSVSAEIFATIGYSRKMAFREPCCSSQPQNWSIRLVYWERLLLPQEFLEEWVGVSRRYGRYGITGSVPRNNI